MKSIHDMTFEELVELATIKIHSALLAEGGKGMKSEVHSWMNVAIVWNNPKEKKKNKKAK